MKKLFLAVLVMAFAGQLSAGNGDLFSYDEQELQTEMATMNELEQFVSQNQGVTLDVMQAEGNELTANVVSSPTDLFGGFRYGDPPLGIPSFVWGCVFNVTGIALVYFITEDNEETKKALWGCVASTVAWGLFYIIYVFAIIGTSTI